MMGIVTSLEYGNYNDAFTKMNELMLKYKGEVEKLCLEYLNKEYVGKVNNPIIRNRITEDLYFLCKNTPFSVTTQLYGSDIDLKVREKAFI